MSGFRLAPIIDIMTFVLFGTSISWMSSPLTPSKGLERGKTTSRRVLSRILLEKIESRREELYVRSGEEWYRRVKTQGFSDNCIEIWKVRGQFIVREVSSFGADFGDLTTQFLLDVWMLR